MKDAFKRVIQKSLNKVGFRLSRNLDFQDPICPPNLLELAVELEKLKDPHNFYYFQVKDGVNLFDSFVPLIGKYRINGCRIELIKNFERSNYYALSEGPTVERESLPSHESLGEKVELYNFIRTHLQSPQRRLTSRESLGLNQSTAGEVPVCFFTAIGAFHETIESIVNELRLDHVSLLHVDTEDSNDSIICSALDSGLYLKVIHYRSIGLSPERRHHLKMRLLDGGYRFVDYGTDTVCLRAIK